MTKSRRHFGLVLVAAWLLALAVAFALDRRTAQWVHDAVPVNKHNPVAHKVLYVLKLPGYFPATVCAAALLALFHRRHLLGALALILTGFAVGVVYSLLKWMIGRRRPVIGIDPFHFHPIAGGLRGLWHAEEGLCFPSGHATLAFASAMCLAMLLPRWGWVFFAIAAITGAERVIENAHYLSDVVAGAGLGTWLGWIVTRRLMRAGE